MQNKAKEERKIYFNFTYYALKLLGKNLYSNPWTAISEIVANGLDAGAPEIYVLLDISNKKESHIEILDTGCGMSIKDLQEKYTLIGRNKRQTDLNPEKVFGRKGIGKLAALYLSPIYYLATKHEKSISVWEINTNKYKDDDLPCLDQVNNRDFLLDFLWKNQENGTLIELSKVDLSKIGEEKIKSLSSILADYYMLESMQSKIYVAVIDDKNRKIEFKEAAKNTYFDTMYAIWDNTKNCVANRLKDKIYLTKNGLPDQIDRPRPTVIISSNNIDKNIEGEIVLVNPDKVPVTKKYRLEGWIGIQGSLDDSVQKRNNKLYKKQVFRGNSLRLYVRGKLAVDNIMNYLNSSQAFANYIEGEINFDILDDNELEDISTSNREGYSITDIRVQKLLSIVKEIVGHLIRKRADIGYEINKEIKQYQNEQLKLEQKEREMAEKAKQEAEIRAENEKQARMQAEEVAESRTNQVYFLQKQIDKDDTVEAYNTHVIKNNAGRINDNVLMLIKNHPETKTYKQVQSIALASRKILSAVNYFGSVNYNFVVKNMKGNLSKFICQYIENVIKKEFYELHITIQDPIDYYCNFPTQDVTVAIENIFSNAYKAGAGSVNVSFSSENNYLVLRFKNDGNVLPNVDKNLLFEFGYSQQTSNSSAAGTGVGLFQIKDCVVKNLGGCVDIYNNDDNGVTLEIKLNENKL